MLPLADLVARMVPMAAAARAFIIMPEGGWRHVITRIRGILPSREKLSWGASKAGSGWFV